MAGIVIAEIEGIQILSHLIDETDALLLCEPWRYRSRCCSEIIVTAVFFGGAKVPTYDTGLAVMRVGTLAQKNKTTAAGTCYINKNIMIRLRTSKMNKKKCVTR